VLDRIYPNQVISNPGGGWTNENGTTNDLHLSVNKSPRDGDDSTYIQTSGTDTLKLGFTKTALDTASSYKLFLYLRYRIALGTGAIFGLRYPLFQPVVDSGLGEIDVSQSLGTTNFRLEYLYAPWWAGTWTINQLDSLSLQIRTTTVMGLPTTDFIQISAIEIQVCDNS